MRRLRPLILAQVVLFLLFQIVLSIPAARGADASSVLARSDTSAGEPGGAREAGGTEEQVLVEPTDEEDSTASPIAAETQPAAPGAQPTLSVRPVKSTKGVPIFVGGREVFRMHALYGPYTPLERADGARARIREVARARDFDPMLVHAAKHDGVMTVDYGDHRLFLVLDGDLPEGRHGSAGEYAPQVAADLAHAIQSDREARTPAALVRATILAAVSLVLLLLAGWVVAFLSRRLLGAVARSRGRSVRSVRFRGLELLSEEKLTAGLLRAVRVIRAAVFLVLAFVTLSVILTLFPWSRPYAIASTDFVLNALRTVAAGMIGYIPKLFMIALILVVFRYINKFVDFLFSSVERGIPVIPGLVPELAAPTRQLARWLSYILALIVIFPYLPGSGSPAFQGVGIFVGLMVSLGSSGPIGNIVSGIVLTYSRSFTVGDRVRIADTTGDIISAGLVSTKVLTIKNEEVTIPNSTILGNHIVNYTKRASQQGLILHTGVTIGYDAPWRTVHKLLTEAALATDGVLHEPLPFVLQTSLDDSYVAYEINAYTRDAGRMVVIYSDLRQNIQDIFNAAGVEIMSPHYAALRDGNTVTTPPDDRPAGYVPGSFRLRGETMPGPSGPTGGRGAGPGGGQVG